ncbi:uncharacterized protein LAJ45_11541 [Morchella importuna]|uniref:uncharacterized protein n=1 Tax=Morchella importuna TaxID=1174673 RepID=UPI001E8CC27A|nr:uncharacterized protein LAJ45_11541 [Morchella importuna]KAH8144476.1 hypothetical protein LAJ45_11541 [Morchella importuna]
MRGASLHPGSNLRDNIPKMGLQGKTSRTMQGADGCYQRKLRSGVSMAKLSIMVGCLMSSESAKRALHNRVFRSNCVRSTKLSELSP